MCGLYGGLRRSRVRRPSSVARAKSGVKSRSRSAFRYALRRKVNRKRSNPLRFARQAISRKYWPRNKTRTIWSRNIGNKSLTRRVRRRKV